jgi:hypothetical protein
LNRCLTQLLILIYDKTQGFIAVLTFMKLNGKKLFLIGFILILLVGIPLTIYFLQKQQETRSKAQKSTNITFSPESSASSPIQKNIGDSIPLDIMVDPGTNLVSFVKLEIDYDQDKLATVAGAFVPNTAVFPTVLEGPVYSPGKIAVTLSVGPDPTKAIQSIAKAGTVSFKALANTPDGQPTLVTYGVTTQVLSIGSGDQASEDVLSSTTPATIAIGGTGPSGSPVPIPTEVLSITPTTTEPTVIEATPTVTPEPTADLSPTLEPSPTGSSSAGTNQVPICNNLAVDRETTGVAPFSITFTASGTDSDGTISKVNFNFGDGGISGDVTTSGGIGTNSINVATSHTYNNAGTYTASAILTDDQNSTSSSSATTCQQAIIVQAGTGGGGAAAPTSVIASSPTPTIAATGSLATTIGIGAVLSILIIGGSLLFFIL